MPFNAFFLGQGGRETNTTVAVGMLETETDNDGHGGGQRAEHLAGKPLAAKIKDGKPRAAKIKDGKPRIEIVEEDTADIMLIHRNGDAGREWMSDDQLHGIAVGLVPSAPTDAAALRLARPFVFAARAMREQKHQGDARLHVLPVVQLTRKIYGDLRDDATNPDCAASVRRESLLGFINRWIDIKRNVSRDTDTSVHEKVWAWCERFSRGVAGGKSTTAGEDTDAVDACGLPASVRRLRLLGPSTDSDGRQMHGGDEMHGVPSWLLSSTSAQHTFGMRFRVERFDPVAYIEHVKSLLAKSGTRVSVVFDTAATDISTSQPVTMRVGTVTDGGSKVRLDDDVMLLAKTGSVAVRVVEIADVEAPWDSGVFLYGDSWPGFRFSKRALLSDPTLRVLMPRDAPPGIWWPTSDQVVAAKPRLPTSMPLMVAQPEFDSMKRLVEAGVAAAIIVDDAAAEEVGSPSPNLIEIMPDWRRTAFLRLDGLVHAVDQCNKEVAKYIALHMASVSKLAGSIQSGGAVVKEIDDEDDDCQLFVAKNAQKGIQTMSWRQLLNNSFRHATAASFAGQMPTKSSSAQGYLTTADLSHVRKGSDVLGDALSYDHIKAVDAACLARIANNNKEATNKVAAVVSRSALEFLAKGDAGRLADVEREVRRIQIWTKHRPPPAGVFVLHHAITPSSTPFDDGSDDQELILSIADVPHYRRTYVVPDEPLTATTPQRLIAAFLDVLGDIDALSAGERRAMLDNYEFYMRDIDATLERQILDVKRRRGELMQRVNLRGEAYELFEHQLIERLRARSESNRIQDGVVIMAALFLLLERVTDELILAAASEVLTVYGETYEPPEMRNKPEPKRDDNNMSRKRERGRSGKGLQATKDGNRVLLDAIAARKNQIARDKPLGVHTDNPKSKSASTSSTSSTEPDQPTSHWPRFRPVMGSITAAPVSTASSSRRRKNDPSVLTTKLLDALYAHIQAQSSLVLGFNRKALRSINACCIRAVAEDGWSDLLQVGPIKALRSAVLNAPPDTDIDVVAGLAPAVRCTFYGTQSSHVSMPGSNLIQALSPNVVTPVVTSMPLQANDTNALKALAEAALGLMADDPAIVAIVNENKWDGLEARFAVAFDTLASEVGLDEAGTRDLRDHFVSIPTDGTHEEAALRGVLAFMRADLAPALRQAGAIGAGFGVGSKDDKKGDVALRELVFRISAHSPPLEASEAANALTGMAQHLTAALRAVHGTPKTEQRRWAMLAGHVGVGAMHAIATCVSPSSRLSPVVASIAGLVMRRWLEKLRFNRSDAREQDEQAVKEEREAVKRERRRLDELLTDDAKELQRELRAAGLGAAGDALRDMAEDDGRLHMAAEEPEAANKKAGEEDARDFYWSGDDGDDVDYDSAVIDGDGGMGVGDDA